MNLILLLKNTRLLEKALNGYVKYEYKIKGVPEIITLQFVKMILFSFRKLKFEEGNDETMVTGQLPLEQLPLGQLPWGQLPQGNYPVRGLPLITYAFFLDF